MHKLKTTIFKLLFAKEIDRYTTYLHNREQNYKQADKSAVDGYVATSNCRMDFLELFLN